MPGCKALARWHAAPVSVQAKALGPHEGTPIGALGVSILARLVFRPAVKIGHTEAVDATLAPDRLFAVAAMVVGLDGFPDLAVLKAVAVHRRCQRQPQTEAWTARGPAKAQAGDREHVRGQCQQLAHLGRVIADGADGSAAEP